MGELIEAELLWDGESFLRQGRLRIGEDGRIAAVGGQAELPGEPDRRLLDRALVPGFVNAHSHAFQRGLRGQGERFPGEAGTFWTWREAMYGLVQDMTPDRMHALSLAAYREMLAAGITCVGEFHYLHHADPPRGGAAPVGELDWRLDEAVQAAAREAGIRQVLLLAYYQSGGFGKPLSRAQQRFRSGELPAFWDAFDRARGRGGELLTLGLVAHSIRAVGLSELRSLHAEAKRRELVFHMHLEEQRLEISECIEAYGKTPMACVLTELEVDERFTAVHCTHTSLEDMQAFLEAGGQVCICPTTEANLGDGLPTLPEAWATGASISLGTDSNARISMLEEMRWLEYGQRLRAESRGMFRDAQGRVAKPLLEAATLGGARSLGVDAGELRVGAWADLITIDLAAASLSGWSQETLLESWIFGGDRVAEVCVGGRWIAGLR